jgi:hypothetical protein
MQAHAKKKPSAGGEGGMPAGPGAMPGGGMPMAGGEIGAANEREERAQRLMSILTTNNDPQSWQSNVIVQSVGGMGGFGGAAAACAAEPQRPAPGAISEYNGLLVVTQTAQTHKKIEHVLDMLRQAAGLETPREPKVVR